MDKIKIFFILALVAVITFVVLYNFNNQSRGVYKGVLVWEESGRNHYGGFYEGK